MNRTLTRRQFVRVTSAATAGVWLAGCALHRPRKLSANDKLNIGVIGTGNRARSNISGVDQENIVALCDIDDNFLAAAKEKYPQARIYNDFRKLLEQKDLDAVVISTAD